MPCSLVERFSVWETLSATISVGYEGIRLVSNDTSLPDYMALHSARSSSSCTFLPNSNPSGSHKTMYRDNGCVVSLPHLEWHFDGAACKNKYIIFSLQQQLLLKWWASKPHKFSLRMAARTFLTNIRENHVHYVMWNPQDDHHLNNLITQNTSCK